MMRSRSTPDTLLQRDWRNALATRHMTWIAVAFLSLLPGSASGDDAELPVRLENQEEPARTMRIHVLGPDDKPVKGAEIHRSVWTREPFDSNRDFTCDDQGTTTIGLPKSIDILRLWAKAGGYVPLFAHWESNELQGDVSRIAEEYTFKLQKGTVIGGVVENEDGQRIAGASVEVMLRVDPREQQNRVCFNTWLAEGEDARVTDAQGRWTLNNVPAGDDVEVLVRLSHPDYINDPKWGVMQKAAGVTMAMLRERTGAIAMARGTRVTGTVTDPAGKPVTGAVVVWGDDPYMMDGSQEVRTDKRGMYRFPPLPPTSLTVTVMAEGLAPAMKNITIDTKNAPVDFQLEAGKTLRLRFVDAAGEPVPDVSVGVQRWRGVASLYNHRHPNVLDTKIPVQSDRNGIYEWKWAPGDQVTYGFWKEGYQAIRDVPYTADGQEHEVQLRQ